MNSLHKLIMSIVFALIATGSFAAPAQAAVLSPLPGISVLTTQVSERIAAVLRTQLAQAVAAPRSQRAMRTASVVITEIAESNAIVVVATRLPALGVLAQAEQGRARRVSL